MDYGVNRKIAWGLASGALLFAITNCMDRPATAQYLPQKVEIKDPVEKDKNKTVPVVTQNYGGFFAADVCNCRNCRWNSGGYGGYGGYGGFTGYTCWPCSCRN